MNKNQWLRLALVIISACIYTYFSLKIMEWKIIPSEKVMNGIVSFLAIPMGVGVLFIVVAIIWGTIEKITDFIKNGFE